MDHPKYYSQYDAPLWESIAKDEMRLQCCTACGHFRYPPGPACPKCLSVSAEWTRISGRAKVLSWATFHKQYLPAYPVPTTVVAAILAEGPIMISNVEEQDATRLATDLPVEIFYADHPDGYRLPRFRIAG